MRNSCSCCGEDICLDKSASAYRVLVYTEDNQTKYKNVCSEFCASILRDESYELLMEKAEKIKLQQFIKIK